MKRFQVPGSRFQVPGSRFQVPGSEIIDITVRSGALNLKLET
jgi:hypothetical protein